MSHHTAIAVVQTPWDCRWVRPGYRVTGVTECDQPDVAWVCLRPTPQSDRRAVTEAECAACEHWVLADDEARH